MTDRANPYARAYREFAANTAKHELEVLHDDGLYRHLRMREPGTGIWHWDVVTWPGHLATSGDIADGFTFTTHHDDEDMLWFFDVSRYDRFTDGAPYIKPDYWSEKLNRNQQELATEYSPDEVRSYVDTTVCEGIADGVIDTDIAEDLFTSFGWVDAKDESAVWNWLSEFQEYLTDWPEGDLTRYRSQFLYACYAIATTIETYREKEGHDG